MKSISTTTIKKIFYFIKFLLLISTFACSVFWFICIFIPWNFDLVGLSFFLKIIISSLGWLFVIFELSSILFKFLIDYKAIKSTNYMPIKLFAWYVFSISLCIVIAIFLILFNQSTASPSSIIILYFKDKTTLFFFNFVLLLKIFWSIFEIVKICLLKNKI